MQRLGSYELIRRLGSGGMAEVWMGRRVAGEGIFKAVAIKVVAAQRADDDRYRRMFLDEARLSMLLGHSNIVQVFDVGVHEGVSFLAMEWIDGLNLAQLTNLARVRQLPIPDSVTAYVVGELLAGLAYAHTVTHEGRALSIIHRDVSPQNVLISVSGEVKLADFGIARIAHDETSGLYVKGKLRYMAPEQLAGVSRAPTVDLYAVGAILHELLDGVRFRDGDDETAIIAQIHSGKIPTLSRTSVPPELDRLRRALLEPNPEARLQSAIAAIELLRLWPGYRNESLVVGRLCRLCLGIAAPRTGISEEPTADASSTPALVSASSTARDPGPPAPRPPAHERGRALPWLGLSTIGLVLTGALAWSVSSRRAPEPEQPARKARAGEEVPSATFELAPARPEVAVKDGPASRPSPGPSAIALTPTASPSKPAPSASSRDRERLEKARPARVEFRAGGGQDGLVSVYLRVTGGGLDINFAAEPNKTMELAPGTYTIQYRLTPEASWKMAGKIKVGSGIAYRARMTKVGDDDAKIVLTEA